MQMPQELIDALNVENPTDDFHGKLLQKCKDLVKLSRDRMQTYYTKWDKYDMVYRGERYRDLQDIKAAERKEPEKIVVPITFSQIETFVAFQQQLLTQRPTFFELDGSGAEDAQAAKVATGVLEYNLAYNNFKGQVLPQLLRDIGRFGIGIVDTSWEEHTKLVEKEVQQPIGDATVLPPLIKALVPVTAYQGNVLTNISPYRFFPDPRVPITKFQKGEFCAHEDESSEHELKKLEAKNEVAGIKYIPKFTIDMLYDGARRVSFADTLQGQVPGSELREPFFYVITKIQIDLIPYDWMIGSKRLGASKLPEKFLVWIANDSRVIKVTPLGYLHNKFTYNLSQYSNDQIRYINFGISEVLEQLQDVQTWFINSHITSVRKVINNYLIVDPKGVEMKDLADRNPVIRVKPAVQGSGVDRWIKQLAVSDVTASHVDDAQVMERFAQMTTGITENILGQFSPGRRSAKEAGNVAQSAAARLILVGVTLWETLIKPLGEQMLSNCRDGMTIPQLVKVLGVSNIQNQVQGVGQFLGMDQQPPMVNPPVGPQPPLAPVPLGGFMQANKDMLIGNYDFIVFDGTLPTQRGAVAATLQELLTVLLQNPELALILQYNPSLILNEILELKGIRNPDRFRLAPDAASQLIQLAGVARNAVSTKPAGDGRSATSRPSA